MGNIYKLRPIAELPLQWVLNRDQDENVNPADAGHDDFSGNWFVAVKVAAGSWGEAVVEVLHQLMRLQAAVNGLKHQTDVGALVWDWSAWSPERAGGECGSADPIVQPLVTSPELNPAERVFEEVRRCVEGRAVPAYRREGGGGERTFLEKWNLIFGRVRITCRMGLD